MRDQPHIPLVVTLAWLKKEGIVGSRRTLYRQIAADHFPQPNCKVGHKIAWTRDRIRGFLEKEGMVAT